MMLIYLKPTNLCNLNCKHCYVPEAKRIGTIQEDNTKNNINNVYKQKMTPEDIDRIYKKILDFSWDTPLKILFHGGEATLAGIDFYEYILKYYGHSLSHSMQTNLLLYSSKWDHIIEELFDSTIGTSFDLTRRFNDSFEQFQDIWMKNYFEAKNKFRISLRMVVSKTFLEKGADYWYNFINELKPDMYGFEHYIVTQGNDSSIAVPYADYLNFLIEFCQLVVNEGKIPNFYPLEQIFSASTDKGLFHGGYFTGNCMKNHIIIDPDGSVGMCPSLVANDLKVGNIFNQDLNSILNGEKRIQHIIKSNSNNCGDCKYSYGICGGGCYAMRYFSNISYDIPFKEITKGKCVELFEYLEGLANFFAENKTTETI